MIQTKIKLLPNQIKVLEQMIENEEARTIQSAFDKLLSDKENDQKNRKALEQFNYNHY